MAHKDKFPGFCTPDESYHGITYATKFGNKGAFITKATAQLMRDFGAIQSPQHAFYINLGLESLHVRMERHCSNALKVAEYLSKNPKIEWVKYPSLKGDKCYELAKKYLPNGSCGVLAFGPKGGRKAAEKLMAALEVTAIETHVADARSCCLHPANATHRQLTDEQLKAAGVRPELVRLSCGIEDADDLIEDLDQAIRKI
ncbi:MAG TPA: O-acetylhomoserine aminocarboxypropyltransferase, partial [Spirochaetaceae bacterium]|nr:O-acetylhomoserine aminocarboxypropyltransferase [Spirochaetaceae bacterium]